MAKKKKILLNQIKDITEGMFFEESSPDFYPTYITNNLKHVLRDYQKFSIRNLLIMIRARNPKNTELHNVLNEFSDTNQFLFRMATGSGKTDIMAASILALYKELGIQRFLFTTNLKSVLRKTVDNLLNINSPKYLFSSRINIDGYPLRVIQVDDNEDFPINEPNTIYIKIASIQLLMNQIDRSKARENRSSLDNLTSESLGILVDESHHFNANAEPQKIDKGENPAAFETTIDNIRNITKENGHEVIQLEFTATLPFGSKGKAKKVRDKYQNKLIYNYPLKEFSEKDRNGSGGYGKHLSQIEANDDITSKMLTGILLNQYRKYLAIKNNFVNFKPVILFKSTTIAGSSEAQVLFENLLNNLTFEQVEQHVNSIMLGSSSQALNWFLSFYNSMDFQGKSNFIYSLKEGYLGHILNANDTKEEDRLITNLNTLDNIDNPFRVVFAVEKVSEGWDVLNLYDIIRISESKKSTNTNAEAQLVGRGSRYYPLNDRNGSVIWRQNFSPNDERIMLETLHYHTIQDKDYLEKLAHSYSAFGIPIEMDTPPLTLATTLKDSFVRKNFYQNGYFVQNTRINPTVEDFQELTDYGFRNGFNFFIHSGVNERKLFAEYEKLEVNKIPTKINREYIVEAMSRIPYYRFNVMKRSIPTLLSKNEFIDSPKWLGKWDGYITFIANKDSELTPNDILRGTIEFLTNVSNLIQKNFMKPKGTKHFQKVPVKDVLTDYYERSFARDSMSLLEVDKINAEDFEWSPYTYIIGDKLERTMVNMINQNIMKELKEEYKTVYLIRNDEAYNKLGIYEYGGSRRYLPDFVLHLLSKDEKTVTQIYLEPKGKDFIEQDKWKEAILLSLGQDIEIVLDIEEDDFILLGVKFFTGSNYEEFERELRDKSGLPAYEINMLME